ncbi:hypothetical protein SARC_01085 [Sphaeroforma arctica JP610]|uniref:DUF4246 domain-containing protein n=1 Tax=Sphaeroforma arctica JP610 TaxID=667725 RepID=A0A0L0GCQ2_9EUKA|nr:hypothetical protein SARC_01085 [Sphaeroforma arctica JP610]KNC86792.1 hypothetical protein SARC_01085 [Sphaeroforma arctica JP610]|eukprot:XP_014160694.1 hypothetical protein SARC_01085 [Sphaeroforma arctica JP610]
MRTIPLTVIESVTCKKNWHTKIQNKEIRDKWRAEMTDSAISTDNAMSGPIHPTVLEWAFDELLHLAGTVCKANGIAPTTAPYVYQSDSLISAHLCSQLKQCVRALENFTDDALDYHPGTNKQVLDLIHPSLFCLISNLSRVVPEPLPFRPHSAWLQILGKGEVYEIPMPDQRGSEYATHSDTYQWLPSDITVGADGQSVSFDSYINNLHPYEHEGLYTCLEAILGRFIPMFERVLTDLRTPLARRDDAPETDELYGEFVYDGDGDSEDERYDDWYENRVPKIKEEMKKFDATKRHAVSAETLSLAGRKLQVIVKMANVRLEGPGAAFDGGHWHVEGMENEHIVSIGIYYYDVHPGLGESRLHFRQPTCEPEYEQGDTQGVEAVYGLVDEEALVQDVGAVTTMEDRCIAFPNVLQHKVPGFTWKEGYTPNEGEVGERKILVFFLVDPTQRVISTGVVPPQQREWMSSAMKDMSELTQHFPPEIVEQIGNKLEWPLSLAQAKEHREKLMHERKYFTDASTEQYFERPFSLCEH